MPLDLYTLYAATAKLADLPAYEARVKEIVPPAAQGQTGQGGTAIPRVHVRGRPAPCIVPGNPPS